MARPETSRRRKTVATNVVHPITAEREAREARIPRQAKKKGRDGSQPVLFRFRIQRDWWPGDSTGTFGTRLEELRIHTFSVEQSRVTIASRRSCTPSPTWASVQLAHWAIAMSLLSVYRRGGGGYLLSPSQMSDRQIRDYVEPLVGIGVVDSENLGTNLAVQVAQQLAHSALAVVSAELFGEEVRVRARNNDHR